MYAMNKFILAGEGEGEDIINSDKRMPGFCTEGRDTCFDQAMLGKMTISSCRGRMG